MIDNLMMRQLLCNSAVYKVKQFWTISFTDICALHRQRQWASTCERYLSTVAG